MGNSLITGTVLPLFERERILTALTLLAFGFAGVILAVAAVRGSWSVPPEGRLLDAFKFEVGVGIYFLTLALLVPRAGMPPRAHRRWVAWTTAIALYFIPIETVQAVRGLDPRFTVAGGTADQVAGALFGLTAVMVVILFAILARRFFRNDVLADNPPLRAAIRYGILAITFAFGTGLVMSALRTRFIADTGNLMPLHAVGFHGIQAVPLVALLAGASGLALSVRMRLTHVAGIAWLIMCIALLAQALSGESLLDVKPAAIAGALALAVWAACLIFAGTSYVRRSSSALSNSW